MPWAYVENGKVKETFDGTRGALLNNVRHSVQIFGNAWTDEQRAEIGLLPLAIDNTKANALQKPTGELEFRIDGGTVYGKPVFRTPPIDQVKGRLIKDISVYAENLKEGQFSKDDRTIAALNLALMEGEERDALKASVAPKMKYINAINLERARRLRQVEEFKDIKQLSSYDWKDGWPFPEE